MNLSELQRKAKERGYGDVECILQTALILHEGWEMDNEAWLCHMKGGKLKLFTTSHGGLCPMPLEELKETRNIAQQSVDEITSILRTLEVQK